MAVGEMIQMIAGAARAEVLSDMGAGLAGLWLGSRPILQPVPVKGTDKPFAEALKLLAPFSNRVPHGFTHEGRFHALPPNRPGEAFAIHGDAFQRKWSVESQSDDRLTLLLPEGRIGPYHYRAGLTYILTPTALRLRLSLTHLGQGTLPYGIGFHPWFPRSGQTRLGFHATGYWPEGDDHLRATETAIPVPEGLDFSTARALPSNRFNAGFDGWDGTAAITQGPDAVSVRLTAADLHTAILYSPGAEAEFFCFEPVSHPVDAHHLPTKPGLVVLGAGETLSREMTLNWEPA